MPESVGTPLLWGVFALLVVLMLALDLCCFHRKAHVVSVREATAWSVAWIGLALLFNLGVYFRFGIEPALEFLTGYVIEKALSVDNLFVFMIIFTYFDVPARFQHRILFWGVLGAVVFRALFIGLGTALLAHFHWVLFLFGGFLVYTGLRIVVRREEQVRPERNPVLRLFRRLIPTVDGYEGARFTVVRNGRRMATPLLPVLAVVEATDVVFAVDSIPAIFAVTLDPFIVFTSNIFAVLGLRALYFVLAGMIKRLRSLDVGLGLVLAFVGVKMLVSDWVRIPVGLSLAIVCGILAAAVAASLLGRGRSRAA